MEIAHTVADSPRSVVTDQVRNGVHVRMAVLYHLLASQDDQPSQDDRPSQDDQQGAEA
jgi:aspartate carbamoyltransferase catalytic subunit